MKNDEQACFSWYFSFQPDPDGNSSSCALLGSSLGISLMASVLPVMIMGAFVPGLRRKYPPHEYIGSTLGNYQEAIFKSNPNTTQMEMLYCSTIVGFPILFVAMIVTGELRIAWPACAQHPYVYGVLVFEACATFVGQVSVLSLVAIFGAATTTMEGCNTIAFIHNIHEAFDRTTWDRIAVDGYVYHIMKMLPENKPHSLGQKTILFNKLKNRARLKITDFK
ncbi:hypothetical protein HAX54_045408 [Datura stramonium]|uniref:Uncharacterized protein n=1 Tax=Datura stramonium TaxID=4076 RepID=A0ABS8SQ77_DATST|nr:hypothetical protein [Datura stramonium]